MISNDNLTPKGFQTFSRLKSGSKKILVAPLNWGLGHATRCIPIVRALTKNGFVPIIASDGDALILLKKEFPDLPLHELPAYNIRYSKGNNQALSILLQSKKILNAVKAEQETVAKIQKKERLSGIISDNRFGVRLTEVPSVYMTHQINVLSGSTTTISSALHQRIIKKFDVCWIPDYTEGFKLSGKMSVAKLKGTNLEYVGALSRFKKSVLPKQYEIIIILSGPEPQRSLLEEKLLQEFKNYNKKVLMVRGVFSEDVITSNNKNMEIVNHLLSSELERAINSSEVVISRSGYSTILDLAKLQKKAFFIPTPGQFEQKYLAKRMQQNQIAPFAIQDAFSVSQLRQIKDYRGFSEFQTTSMNTRLFDIF